MNVVTSPPPQGYFAELLSVGSYQRLLYLLLSFPLGLTYFIVMVVGFVLALGLLVIWLGIPIGAATLWLMLRFADLERAQARLLGLSLTREPPILAAPGFWNWMKGSWGDAGTYKALLYLLLKFPMGMVSFVVVVTLGSVSLFLLMFPLLHLYGPLPMTFGNDLVVFTPLGWVGWMVVAVAFTVLSCSMLNLLADGWAVLAKALLTDYGEGRRAQLEVQALKQTSSAVAYSGSLEETLSHIADQGMGALGAGALAFAVQDAGGWRIAAQKNLPEVFVRAYPEAQPRLKLPEGGVQGRAHLEKHLLKSWNTDVLVAPLLGGLPQGTLVVLPLMYQQQFLGQLLAFYPSGVSPTQRELEFLAALADQGAVSVETSHMIERIQAQTSQNERARLARELHDSVAQALYGITLGAKTAKGWLARDPEKVKESLDYAIQLAEGGTAEMKALLFSLREDALDEGGLCEALSRLAYAMKVRYGLNILTDLPAEPTLPSATKHALYRIAQEAVHNTIKHARASEASICLKQTALGWTLEVKDNGRGFEADGLRTGSLGLKSMRERAQALGGEFTVTSTSDTGTCIRVDLPLK